MKSRFEKYRKYLYILALLTLVCVVPGCGAKKQAAESTKTEETAETGKGSGQEAAQGQEAAAADGSQSVFDFMGDSAFNRLREDMEAGQVPVECKVRYETQTARPDVRTKDPETIRKLYDYLARIRVLDKAPEGSSGSVHTITFRLRNDTYAACRFDGGRYICRGLERYDTSGSDLLLSCIEQMEETALARAEAQKAASASGEKDSSGAVAATASAASEGSGDGSTLVWDLPEEEEKTEEEQDLAEAGQTGEVPASGLETADQLLRKEQASGKQTADQQTGSKKTADKETIARQTADKADKDKAPDQDLKTQKEEKKTGQDPVGEIDKVAIGTSDEELEEGTGLAMGQVPEDELSGTGIASLNGPAGEDDVPDQTGTAAGTGTASVGGPAGEDPVPETEDGPVAEEPGAVISPASEEDATATEEDAPATADIEAGEEVAAASEKAEADENPAAEKAETAKTNGSAADVTAAKAQAGKAAAEKTETEKAEAGKTALEKTETAKAQTGKTGGAGEAATAAAEESDPAADLQEAYTAILRAYAAAMKLDKDQFLEDYDKGVYDKLKESGDKAGQGQTGAAVEAGAGNPAEKLVNYDLLWAYFRFQEEKTSLLYGLHDYNEDGVKELAVALGTQDYSAVWAVYSFDGKKAVELFTGPLALAERSNLYCLPDGTFLVHQSGGASAGADTICRIARGGKGLEIIGQYEYDAQGNGSTDYINGSERIPFEEFQDKYWKVAEEASAGIQFTGIEDNSRVDTEEE